MKAQDLTGKVFERFTVIRFHGHDDKNKRRMWLCECECGGSSIASTDSLNNGHVKSCGCLSIETTINRNTKHGYSKRGKQHPLITVLNHMIQRCTNPNDKAFIHYGARNINICSLWRNNPSSFVKWGLSNGWSPELTIDRIDNNSGYSPVNCRFVTQAEQLNNTRVTIFLTFDNKTLLLSDWAKEVGIKRNTLYSRLYGLNWSIEKALTTPLMSQNINERETVL